MFEVFLMMMRRRRKKKINDNNNDNNSSICTFPLPLLVHEIQTVTK
jgi:hypothetical protein